MTYNGSSWAHEVNVFKSYYLLNVAPNRSKMDIIRGNMIIVENSWVPNNRSGHNAREETER